MNTLNLGSDEMPEKKKKSNTRNLKIALGLAAVILVPTIGSTLAGSIAVSGSSIEFGQGVVATAACDTVISVTPSTTLTTVFNLTGVAVSDIWNTTSAGCAGKYLTLKVLNAAGTLQNITNGAGIGGSATQIKFLVPATCVADEAITEVTNATVTTGVCSSHTGSAKDGADTGTIAIVIATALDAVNVDKITLESSSS